MMVCTILRTFRATISALSISFMAFRQVARDFVSSDTSCRFLSLISATNVVAAIVILYNVAPNIVLAAPWWVAYSKTRFEIVKACSTQILRDLFEFGQFIFSEFP